MMKCPSCPGEEMTDLGDFWFCEDCDFEQDKNCPQCEAEMRPLRKGGAICPQCRFRPISSTSSSAHIALQSTSSKVDGGQNFANSMSADFSSEGSFYNGTFDDSQSVPRGVLQGEIGDYLIEEFIARGGMGEVYRVRHSHTDLIYALKTIVTDNALSQRAIKRFLNEFKIIQGLNHCGIVRVNHCSLDKSRQLYYIVMEYLEGRSLEAYINEKGAFSLEECTAILKPLCAALSYAHERNVLHRDIKPANIFLCGDERVPKLLDFGLARQLGHSSMTLQGASIGTAIYMAPEQSSNAADVDERADIYSLAMTVATMLLGRIPAGSFSRRLPEKVRSLFDDSLSDELEERPQSTRSFFDRWQQAIQESSLAQENITENQNLPKASPHRSSEDIVDSAVVTIGGKDYEILRYRSQKISVLLNGVSQAAKPFLRIVVEEYSLDVIEGNQNTRQFGKKVLEALAVNEPLTSSSPAGGKLNSFSHPENEAHYNQALVHENAEEEYLALKYFLKAASQGHHQSETKCIEFIRSGLGIDEDEGELIAILSQEAESGKAWAEYCLGGCYYNGYGIKEDYTEAVTWYRKAAEQGNAEGQFSLGEMYDDGSGVAQDSSDAAKWYRKAAEQGNAEAQCALGFSYANGNGVIRSGKEALKWIKKSADFGNDIAQCFLGFSYANGKAVKKDHSKAALWYWKSADLGNAEAQYALGLIYLRGDGVVYSKQEASKWLHKAALQGHHQAQENLRLF